MLSRKELEIMKGIFERETGILEIKEKYEEYKKLDTPRNFEKMRKNCVLDDYLKFMSDCEDFLSNDGIVIDEFNLEKEEIKGNIELPKPSPALEKFKNKFNKFF